MNLFQIVMKCPGIEALFIQDIQVCIIRFFRTIEANTSAVETLYNDCLWKLFKSLKSTRKLGLLRLNLFLSILFYYDLTVAFW